MLSQMAPPELDVITVMSVPTASEVIISLRNLTLYITLVKDKGISCCVNEDIKNNGTFFSFFLFSLFFSFFSPFSSDSSLDNSRFHAQHAGWSCKRTV